MMGIFSLILTLLQSRMGLKERYHEQVTNVRYAVVSLTMVRQGKMFCHFRTHRDLPLVTSRMWQEGSAVTTYQFLATSS